MRGMSGHLRSDSGPKYTAKAVRGWQSRVIAEDAVHRTWVAMGHGYIESFNGNLGDELLDREAFNTLLVVRVLIEQYR